MRIAVSGYGIICAIGDNKQQVLQSLVEEKHGLAHPAILDTVHKDYLVGEVRKSNAELQEMSGANTGVYSRSALLAMLAADEAIDQAGIRGLRGRSALVSGTTVGGMDLCEQYFEELQNGIEHRDYIEKFDAASCTADIAAHCRLFSSFTNVSTACSSGENAIMLGANLLRSQQADRVVAGGCESLTKFHLNGFSSLMIMDKEPCRPFDVSRRGLNLGEGAAYLVLERLDDLLERGGEPLAILSGWGNRCDAYHQTASSPAGEGAYGAMAAALQAAGLRPCDIDYINAHGTGTEDNDSAEAAAIRRLFKTPPPLSSTKGFTGHSTSAAGAVEAVICLMAMQHGFVPANLNLQNPLEGMEGVSAHNINNVSLKHVMDNSFGFGGNDTSLIFSSYSK